MDLLERTMLLAIGGAIGFILGYIVRSLRDIQEKVDEVDDIVKHTQGHGEKGAMRLPSLASLFMALVVLVTVWAAFAASSTNSELGHTVTCLTRFNTHQNEALTARDNAIKQETAAEIDLWGLYNRLYREGTLPNTTPAQIKHIQDILAQAIRDYRVKLIKTQAARNKYSYSEPDVLKNCEEKPR